MIYSSKDMESRAVLDTAAKVCAAALSKRFSLTATTPYFPSTHVFPLLSARRFTV